MVTQKQKLWVTGTQSHYQYRGQARKDEWRRHSGKGLRGLHACLRFSYLESTASLKDISDFFNQTWEFFTHYFHAVFLTHLYCLLDLSPTYIVYIHYPIHMWLLCHCLLEQLHVHVCVFVYINICMYIYPIDHCFLALSVMYLDYPTFKHWSHFECKSQGHFFSQLRTPPDTWHRSSGQSSHLVQTQGDLWCQFHKEKTKLCTHKVLN